MAILNLFQEEFPGVTFEALIIILKEALSNMNVPVEWVENLWDYFVLAENDSVLLYFAYIWEEKIQNSESFQVSEISVSKVKIRNIVEWERILLVKHLFRASMPCPCWQGKAVPSVLSSVGE